MSLSQAQVEAYLDRISLPTNVRDLLREGPEGRDALKAVAALQQHHLATIPFENLDLCYSAHKTIPQGTETVFDHVITRKRGGVCDQVHPLFARLLRSLGFVVYLTGARINAAAGILQGPGADISKPSFTPWFVFSHSSVGAVSPKAFSKILTRVIQGSLSHYCDYWNIGLPD